jgi:uncharacterized protein
MTLSMHEASIAAAHAETRKIEPEIMLALRLSPNMYSLRQQVGEANRHAILAGALLSGCESLAVPDAVSDIPELKSRIRAVVGFLESLPRAAIDAAADREVVFTFKNGNQRTFTGRSLLLSFSVPQFFVVREERVGG